MKCIQCGQGFLPDARARAAIAIFVLGDEVIYSYWYCAACETYTVEAFHDRFLGEHDISFLPPMHKAVGDRCVELIGACPDPGNKHCDCASHRALYHGVP